MLQPTVTTAHCFTTLNGRVSGFDGTAPTRISGRMVDNLGTDVYLLIYQQ